MKNRTKHFMRAGALALGMTIAAPMTASAGEWRLDPRRCPDLMEDYRDMRRDRGWQNRREDRRDQRVISCPARAWTYDRDRYERGVPLPYPRKIVVTHDGRVYERDLGGRLLNLGVDLNLGIGLRL
ncbi:MAG: hypothetical protein B7Y90_06030 [Alphaproteobacteria bacterium 32-64-14]|nr:MAG: hypothetical protein B7Y90_06030 [Alphaproteobacteria bacterium 32-64-14]